MGDGGFRDKRILIAGLGVIGGSVAKSLWKAGCVRIDAYDRDENALRSAQTGGVIRDGYTLLDDAPMCDIVVCCLPPHLVAACYQDTAPHIISGGVFAEMSGLKTRIIPVLERALRDDHELLSLASDGGQREVGLCAFRHPHVRRRHDDTDRVAQNRRGRPPLGRYAQPRDAVPRNARIVPGTT